MADTSISDIREAIREFLKGADLSQASSKKVRAHLNNKFDCDFASRKKEIDKVVMDVLTELEGNDDEENEASAASDSAEDSKPKQKKRASKKQDSDDDSDEPKPKRKSNGSAKAPRKSGGGGGKATGYLKKLKLSKDLAEAMGEDHMARNEVVKKMYALVKERDLLDPKNRQFAILDPQLQKVFGQKRIRMFGMMKLLGKHFSAAD